MPGVVTGVDSKGRRYKTINGKRVTAADQPTSSKGNKPHTGRHRPETSMVSPTALKDPLRRIFVKYLGRGGDPSTLRTAIAQIINLHLHTLFNIAAKTSVGKFGKAYAAREILAYLRTGSSTGERNEQDTAILKRFTNENGDLDGPAFLRHIKSKYNVPIKGEFLGQETPMGQETETSEDDDAAILGVVHKYHLNADQLDRILSRTLKNEDEADERQSDS